MLIDLTYRCNMGCNHCMSDCKPNGTDMTPEILKDVLAFCKKNEVPNLIFSGGEMFENPHILELLKIIEKEWDKRFPLSFITNGRKLADTPDIFEAVQDMQKKYGKKKIMIQVTDDPRFYPQPLSEKQKYRLQKLDAVIEGVPGNGNKCLYPQGRTLENFDDSWWNTIAPKCVNVRLLAKQGVDSIRGIVNTLFRAGKVCMPSISPAGEIKLGESALCPSVASIYDTEQEIIEKIQRCRCQSCEYSWQQLKSTSIKAFEMLEKN